MNRAPLASCLEDVPLHTSHDHDGGPIVLVRCGILLGGDHLQEPNI